MLLQSDHVWIRRGWPWPPVLSSLSHMRFVKPCHDAVGGADLLSRVEVARGGAWPAVHKCLMKWLIIVNLSVVTVFPSLSAVGSWEDVLLFSMDFTVSKDYLELVIQDANFSLKKLALAFLTECVYWFLTSLKMCISRGLFDANAVRHRMLLCWSRAVRSGVNQGLYLFLVLHFLNGASLFKMVRTALLKNNQASSTDGVRSISFQDTQARSIRKACSLKCFRFDSDEGSLQSTSQINILLSLLQVLTPLWLIKIISDTAQILC